MTDVVRVIHSPDGHWMVQLAGQDLHDLTFKKRVYAEAFGRALAQRAKKDLMVLGQDGVSRLTPDASLTYASVVD